MLIKKLLCAALIGSLGLSVSAFAASHSCNLKNKENLNGTCHTGALKFLQGGIATNGIIIGDHDQPPYVDSYWEKCTITTDAAVAGDAIVSFSNVVDGQAKFCSNDGVFSSTSIQQLPLNAPGDTTIYVKHNHPQVSGDDGKHIYVLNPACQDKECHWQMHCQVVPSSPCGN